MQTLASTLLDQDFGQLRIIAELWGLDLSPGSVQQAADELSRAMLDGVLLAEVVDSLPASARDALDAILRNQGRLPLADLTRKFGLLRQMGPGRRDREQPWRNPASPVETLWYRGLIGRAFFDTPTGLQEFAYVPGDLAALMPAPDAASGALSVHPASQPSDIRYATDFAVDDLVTLLAALRRQPVSSGRLTSERLHACQPFLYQPRSARLLIACLVDERVLSQDRLTPDPDAVRALLDSPRPKILERVRRSWRESPTWNDLAQVPHLVAADGEWPNDPPLSRKAILEFLSELSIGEWWDLAEFIQAIHDTRPAFQRPAGDFDSWYLQDSRTGSFVRGLAHWHAVEGALIHHVISGPLHWLGMVDLGLSGTDGPAVAFRLTPSFDPSASPGTSHSGRAGGLGPQAQVRPDGLISVPRYCPPALRYQIARICAWESRDADGYRYRLTPDGLALASAQGLQPNHVRSILEEASGSALPKSLTLALERWSAQGTQARLERMLVFNVDHPALLEELRANRSTARFLRSELGPRSAAVAERDWRRLCEAAARLGILIAPPDPPGGNSI
jgi:hypothetical protein